MLDLFWTFPGVPGLRERLTINRLDASAVVVGELKVFGFKPLVEGRHDGRRVVGVLQTQSVTQLMDGNQENIVTFRGDRRGQTSFQYVLV